MCLNTELEIEAADAAAAGGRALAGEPTNTYMCIYIYIHL